MAYITARSIEHILNITSMQYYNNVLYRYINNTARSRVELL